MQRRLALLYGGAFLASGFVLLAITVIAWQQRSARTVAHTAPVPAANRLPPAVAQTGLGLASQQHNTDLHQLLIVAAIALAITGVAAVAVGWLVAGRILHPLRTITATARRISATNLHERLSLHGPDDELHELGDTLDELFGRLDASFQSQRHFVANASHELRTPLTAERTLLQVALADPDATVDDLRIACQKVLAIGKHQERLIDSLLTLATGERGIELWEPLDLAAIANTVTLAYRDETQHRGLEVITRLDPAPASGDPHLAERLVANLIDNAIHHNRPDGRIEITTSTVRGWATITVVNTGPVIPRDQVDQIFEPFQRAGAQRLSHPEGHGLGLAIVKTIADAHRATVVAHAQPGGGLHIAAAFPPTTQLTAPSPRDAPSGRDPWSQPLAVTAGAPPSAGGEGPASPSRPAR